MEQLQGFDVGTLSLEHRMAYLQGVCSSMPIQNSDQQRVLVEVVRLMGDVVDAVTDLKQRMDQLEQYVDDMDDDLANLEEAVFDGLNDEDLDEKAPDGHSMLVSFADVPCPHCGLHFFVDEDFWAAQDVVDVDCPNCHESVEVSKSGLNPSH
ncbi:CD1247 N-terminal domain-containing protein [Alicyclobacillus pomorum]|jgi:DNA-directed RNA polymerase subunit delta|uniref:CD1247 N-terminal domain-containing protein n=1 Tax=Alicyclobacillus pomorum TaxID=204470 RepID=UPI00040944A3|nr:CD1247 N-terminal domain-containing protein [Alicyclobacillus pomorum]